jgi:hypothetical protein
VETRLKNGQNLTTFPHYDSTPNAYTQGWLGSYAYTSPSVQSSHVLPLLLEKVVL